MAVWGKAQPNRRCCRGGDVLGGASCSKFDRGRARDRRSIVFWFMMQIGMIFGFLSTYPANALLIRRGIKQGM